MKSSNISQQLNLQVLEKELGADRKTQKALEHLRRPIYPMTFEMARRKREENGKD